jgi:glycosyltransferase involved in cell wall biosynthesis
LKRNKLHIVFLLPGFGVNPVGGYKVVYEYANRFAADGYRVSIVYPANIEHPDTIPVRTKIRDFVRWVRRGIRGSYSCRHWFALNDGVKECWRLNLLRRHVPKGDIYVATAWRTAEYLDAYRDVLPERKFYFIQAYENWDNDEARLLRTWKASLRKIVIAPWLKEIAAGLHEEVLLVENGFDFDRFRLTIPIEEKDSRCLCMLYHDKEWKGCDMGFDAIGQVRERFPDLKVNLFGVPKMTRDLPEYYRYYRSPDKETLNALYNESAIFMGTSYSEGWGLTVGEAMQCGCAVACTDNGGYASMALHGQTALVSPVGDAAGLAANIIRLIENEELRYNIAKQGNLHIQQFTWERAYSLMKSVLVKVEG